MKDIPPLPGGPAALRRSSRSHRVTVRHTGGALAGSALTTIAGFGILITSSLVPFSQMGQVTALAIAFALVAAVFVLPSMLILWDRWHTRRGQLSVARTTEHRDLEHGEREAEPV